MQFDNLLFISKISSSELTMRSFVDADFAEFAENDSVALAVGLAEHTIEQGRLA